MLWKIFQLTVFLAVSFTGIYYQWTPNGLVLSLVAGLASLAATVFLLDLFRFLSWSLKTGRVLFAKHRKDDRLTRGR